LPRAPVSGSRCPDLELAIVEAAMRIFSVWVIEFLKLIGRRRLHPINAECPICHQMIRLHYNKAGRRHVFAHARATSRALYEGSRYGVHYAAKIKCLGSGTLAKFDPRPNENQRFKPPKSLEEDGRQRTDDRGQMGHMTVG
jgi:hypothetical protein